MGNMCKSRWKAPSWRRHPRHSHHYSSSGVSCSSLSQFQQQVIESKFHPLSSFFGQSIETKWAYLIITIFFGENFLNILALATEDNLELSCQSFDCKDVRVYEMPRQRIKKKICSFMKQEKYFLLDIQTNVLFTIYCS